MTTEEVTVQINNLSITSSKPPRKKEKFESESSSDSEDEYADYWIRQKYLQDPKLPKRSSIVQPTTPGRSSAEDVFYSPQATTPGVNGRRSYYHFVDKIQLPERTQKLEYEQAKIDSVILKQDQVIKKSIDRLIRSYQKTRDQTIQQNRDNKISVQWNSIRRDLANEMKTMFDKRTAFAVIFDDIDKFYNDARKNHETLCREFMEHFELEKRTTRSRNSSGTVEIHNYNNYEYNKNADFILRNQNRSNKQSTRSNNNDTRQPRSREQIRNYDQNKSQYRSQSRDRPSYSTRESSQNRSSYYENRSCSRGRDNFVNRDRSQSVPRWNNDHYRNYNRDQSSSNREPSTFSREQNSPGHTRYENRNRRSNYSPSNQYRNNNNYRSERNKDYSNSNRIDRSADENYQKNDKYRQYRINDTPHNRNTSPHTLSTMRRGINCDDDYDPAKRYCSKCNDPGHHPWTCQTFNEWRRSKCLLCRNGNHHPEECRNRMTSLNY